MFSSLFDALTQNRGVGGGAIHLTVASEDLHPFHPRVAIFKLVLDGDCTKGTTVRISRVTVSFSSSAKKFHTFSNA